MGPNEETVYRFIFFSLQCGNTASKLNTGGCVEQLITHGHSCTHNQKLASGGSTVSCCRVICVIWVLTAIRGYLCYYERKLSCTLVQGNHITIVKHKDCNYCWKGNVYAFPLEPFI